MALQDSPRWRDRQGAGRAVRIKLRAIEQLLYSLLTERYT